MNLIIHRLDFKWWGGHMVIQRNMHGYLLIFLRWQESNCEMYSVTSCGHMRPPVLTHQVQKGSSNTLVKGSEGFMWCLRFFLCDTGIAKRVCCPPCCTIHRVAVQCHRSLRGFRGGCKLSLMIVEATARKDMKAIMFNFREAYAKVTSAIRTL